MRFAWLAAVVAVGLMAHGCAEDQKRIEREKAYSATRMSGKFSVDDPLVHMLSAEQRQAMARQGLLQVPEDGDVEGAVAEAMADADGDGEEDDLNKSNMDKAGDIAMSVLSVSITLGMMVAPYLLF
jgi:hypothetical protein